MILGTGHGNVVAFKSTVEKKVNASEYEFYTKLASLQEIHPSLKEIMPRATSFRDGKYVSISRVGAHIRNAQMCDIKIGYKTFFPAEATANNNRCDSRKVSKMMFLDRVTGSNVNGFRVEGAPGTDKSIRLKDPVPVLKDFLGNNTNDYHKIIERLKKIHDIMSMQDFTIVGSSVLIAYSPKTSEIDIKLIDFAHPFFKHQGEKDFFEMKDNFLGGLEKLINTIKHLKFEKENEKLHTKPLNEESPNKSHADTRSDSYVYKHSGNKKSFDRQVNMCADDFSWDFNPNDFSLKVNSDGTPDIVGQNKSSARIWFHTLFDSIPNTSALFEPVKDKINTEQQHVLMRNLCALICCEPMIGEQSAWKYETDEKSSVAQLISSGGRFGYIFNDGAVGRRFFNYLLTGDENINADNAVALKLTKNGTKKHVKTEGNNPGHAGLYSRFSTHDQKLENGCFKEVKAYTKAIGGSYGMDFSIGGAGNAILENNKSSLIAYEGHSADNKYQLGTMLIKFDESQGKARLMCGFESTAPYLKNQFGGSHGYFATINKVTRRFFFKIAQNIHKSLNNNAILNQSRSLTGQSKGRDFGIYSSYGSNVAFVDEQKFQRMKTVVTALEQLNLDERKDFVKQILLSNTPEKREEIIKQILSKSLFLAKQENPQHISLPIAIIRNSLTYVSGRPLGRDPFLRIHS